jgi:hypothetical protein
MAKLKNQIQHGRFLVLRFWKARSQLQGHLSQGMAGAASRIPRRRSVSRLLQPTACAWLATTSAAAVARARAPAPIFFYNDVYKVDLPDGHRFPMVRCYPTTMEG